MYLVNISKVTLQYGFKKDVGCVDALFTFNESVRYFTSRGSRVFCVSLDANKAFDRVLHSGLLLKLLQKGLPVKFVKLLRLWYSRQTCAVLWNSVLGDRFDILCGVRQGGVLSPILFSTYIDDVICVLRNSGYGICVGSVFIGCIVYADDIILLSASCHGIQKLADLCVEYGRKWDIIFNPRKTQCITFGGKQPTLCTLTLDGVNLEWCDKLKYLGCYFKSISCHSDITHRIRNYYGCLNNILSVLGRGKNEITAVHLVRTYCIPILTYGSEIWHITESEKRSLNVLWNNTFRKIFNCYWRESPFSLQFYTGCLPMHLIIEQQKVLFYRRVLRSSNVILQTLLCLKQRSVNSLTSLYSIRSLNVSCNVIKHRVWEYNIIRNAVNTGHLILS